ncbi:Transcriptional regulator GlxA family, contains an amidase domain and an AraC-type DNA-binding HTH domain [Actinopolymorpha cephalotaxi]|uniref:Transcriptional regulator GlxA family with amidase domain n=1 Tax=Actinopolymorpha cephalotaxi TaxID=504797 RepID=A0A1I2WZE4_9ACTN|nr:DJ-1/PfpI family protein [Actinopolymorpha cephalotaxi]NYH85186.1 transcriptional regulator GlxA family with amidase domain [Actinopolymorpha cephalotaxi]SFH05999.1 Transcriptional regulator GlxA family, contains an amidase domain and an AraC-type DNA-binding HTH domain [Actinopolymorpha cephalotaxi]
MSERSVVVVGYERAELVDIACVTSALMLATRLGARPAYDVRLATVDGRDIVCESGLVLRAQLDLSDVRETVDTLIVSGGDGHLAAAADLRLVHGVRQLASRVRRVASVCTGTAILAEAGLLDGRRATTHWFYADDLIARYPKVSIDPAPIFVRDGNVATSGGVTASLDLTLAFVEEDHGPELARWVAMGMVAYLKRPGNQAQMSVFTRTPRPGDATVRRVVDHAAAHPDDDLRTETLAAMVGVSPRQLHRLFRAELGETPANVVRRTRLEVAARLAATTDLPLSQVARRSGFASAESLRQAFVSKFGTSPRTFRHTQAHTSP